MGKPFKGISPQTNLPYKTGNQYARYLAGYERRYGLVPLNDEQARAHAESMADEREGDGLREFVRGFMDGYRVENRETQAHE